MLVQPCQNVIVLCVESGESTGVPTSTWNVSTQQSRASMQVNMFTGEPHTFCDISCYETAKVVEYSVV